MTEASFSNFFNRPFGLNVKVPERTLKQAGDTLQNTAGGVLTPLTDYLEDNEKVFTGEVAKEINKIFSYCFNIGAKMQAEDVKVNGKTPNFDTKF
ncbi:MAG: hypothetical protein WCF95_08020 [bacterium]